MAPTVQLNPSYTWSIQNGTDIASITQDGVLSVSNTGTVTVRLTTTYAGSQTKTADFSFSVTQTDALNETVDPDITITPASATLDWGGTQVYEVPATLIRTRRTRVAFLTITPNGGGNFYKVAEAYTTIEPTIETTHPSLPLMGNNVQWTPSDNTAYTYFSMTSNAGSVTLTRSANLLSEDRQFQLNVEARYGDAWPGVVKNASAMVTIPFSEVDLTRIYNCSASSANLTVGQTATLSFEYQPQDQGQGRPHVQIEYTSSNTDVATVDPDGRVTAVGPGSATITIQSKKIDGTNGDSCDNVTIQVTTPAAQPTFSRSSTNANVITVTSATQGATIYYTINGGDPTVYSQSMTNGATITLQAGQTLRAIAANPSAGYTPSPVATFVNGDGSSSASPYPILSASDLATVSSYPGRYYLVQADFSAPSNTSISNFTGTFDGNYHTISGLGSALFNSINGGTVKNVRLADVSISGGTDAGALANTASSNSKIYNCGVLSGSVSGSGSVGGLIGKISGNTKVVNNYNYASISGGQYAAGVVGQVASLAQTVRVRIKHVESSNYLTEYNGALQIRTDGNGGFPNWQYWDLEPSESGYKIKNFGRNEYIAVNGYNATFNATGDVFTLVKQSDGTYYINRSDGRSLGTDANSNGSVVYTNKQGDARDKWQLDPNVVLDILPMVANCVNYGTEVSGSNTYPVYGGNDLDNKKNPLYDFFLYDGAAYRESIASTNGALPAEARFLNRFEYVRATLNAEKKLMAYYLFGTQNNANDLSEIGKWVLDKEIAPYPIIKKWGKYPSLVNPDFESRSVGTLSVTINNNGTTNLTLPISDQNTDEFDYGYHKVQLPYYNDYFNNNYQANRVVTGWKITGVTGGKAGTFSTSGTNAYNFADRDCTQKDLFSVSGRVFAQGGFYYVPEGVTAITIEPYWADDVVYLHDPNIDKVFGMGYSETNFGPTYQPTFTVPDGAKVRNTLRDAHDALTASTNVYDHAIVLIGNVNFRRNGDPLNNTETKAYTIMSIDEDHDNEPDYAEIYGHVDRRPVPPTRLDFVHQVGISWVKKPMGETLQSYSGIPLTRGQFEITETAFARFTEFETGTHVNQGPLIFNAGLIDQFVTNRDGDNPNITYAILGGHTYFKAYTPGCHPNSTRKTTFWPASVMGGEYDEFYLTGMKSEVNVAAQDGRVYTNGGKMGTFAGAYWEQLNGNAYIRFDHTWVNEFFGGGINPAKPITGNIDIIIKNCDVEFFCAGPKAGNMTADKTVTTVATNDRFGTYVGAGYGGSSVARFLGVNGEHVNGNDYMFYKNTFFSENFDANYLKYVQDRGILIRYTIEYMPGSGGMGGTLTPTHVTRFYNEYAQLNLARTYSVTSTLNGCTITGNFYGGPWSGTVGTNTNRQTVVSRLTDCTVRGSVFGGGKSAEIPTITVYPKAPTSLNDPLYNGQFGMYYQQGEDNFPVYPTGTEFFWVAQAGATPQANATAQTLETNVDLNNLGTVFGSTQLTVTGGTVFGDIFGAGDASKVVENTDITVKDCRVYRCVFGGGCNAETGGNTQVKVQGTTNVGTYDEQGKLKPYVTPEPGQDKKPTGNVYGGGFGGKVGGNTHVIIGSDD